MRGIVRPLSALTIPGAVRRGGAIPSPIAGAVRGPFGAIAFAATVTVTPMIDAIAAVAVADDDVVADVDVAAVPVAVVVPVPAPESDGDPDGGASLVRSGEIIAVPAGGPTIIQPQRL